VGTEHLAMTYVVCTFRQRWWSPLPLAIWQCKSLNLFKFELQILTKNSQKLDLNIAVMNNQITSSKNTKFLSLTIEETLSWKSHIKRLQILPLQSQYILSTLLFVITNKYLFTTNQEIHNINTKYNTNLHPPICNLMIYQKGVYFSGIKLFNHLPPNIKTLSKEIKLFKPALKRFLFLHSFYSVEEYFGYMYN
jgi:hypothetical protein